MLCVKMRYLTFPNSVSMQHSSIPKDRLALHRRRRALSWVSTTSLVFLALSTVASAQSGSTAYMALPQYGDNGSADSLFYVDLGNGRVELLDQLRRNPDSGRREAVSTNLFSEIGRAVDQVAGFGELFLGPIQAADGSVRSALLVEASTGYTLYFDQLGKGGGLGRATTMIKRGFEPIASTDGNFVLLMQRGSSGKTEGAYLYHGTTGAAMHLGKVDELEIDPPTRKIDGLPAVKGWVSATSILASEETVSYVVIDNADGQVMFFDSAAGRLTARSSNIAMQSLLLAEKYNPATHRFVPVPLQDSDSTTYAVLIVDVGTGILALLEDLRRPTQKLGVLPVNLYSAVRGGLKTDVNRWLTAVPANDASGETRGVWVRDSATGIIVYVEAPGQPGQTKVRPMALSR